MVFNSLTFVLFFGVVLVSYAGLANWNARKLLLIFASYTFYAAWNPPFVALLAISTLVDWLVARKMDKTEHVSRRKLWLSLSIAVNLGMLGYFKYGQFALDNFAALSNSLGIEFTPAATDIILPVGISFFTFQTLSYSIDVYRRKIPANASLLDFGLFVCFFPQLVAGPIVRARDFLPQCKIPRIIRAPQLSWGLFLMTWGMFQKNVLADTMLAPASEVVFNFHRPPSSLDAWIGVMAFSGQIFCDFAGYSTCAIGAALCLGFHLPNNFQAPYAAVGLRDFWRRWHISLSSWLRDYLYISMGGNRHGRARMMLALAATMLLGGLWHGASWNFVIWGALHGLYLVVERTLTKRLVGQAWTQTRSARVAAACVTYLLVCIAWVFFRSRELPVALGILGKMFSPASDAPALSYLQISGATLTMAAIFTAHIVMRDRSLEYLAGVVPTPVIRTAWAAMIVALILTQGSGHAFIYFQF